MFYPNADQTDYRYKVALAPTKTLTTTAFGVETYCALQVRYGTGYVAGVHGIELKITAWIPLGSTTQYHKIELVTPWGSYSTGDIAGAWTSYSAILTLTKAGVTTDCDNWTFDMGGLDLSIDNVSVYTLGIKSDSGTGFDLRYDTVYGATQSTVNPAKDFSQIACNTATTAYTAYVAAIPATIGWQLKDDSGNWKSRPVELNLIPAIPTPAAVGGCPECTCDTTAIGEPAVDPEDQSWTITLTSHDSQELGKTSPVTRQCWCRCHNSDGSTSNCGNPWSYSCYTFTGTYLRYYSDIAAAPTDAQIYPHIYTAGAKCWCCEVSEADVDYTLNGPNSETEVITYAATGQYTQNMEAYRTCCDVTVVGNCPLPDPDLPPPEAPGADCAVDTAVCCVYKAYRTVQWDTVNCVGFGDQPDTQTAKNGDTFLAYRKNNQIWCRHKILPTQSWRNDVQVTTSGTNKNPSLGITHNNYLVLLYNNNTNAVERWSFDEGETWTSETLAITSGLYPEVCCGANGDILRAGYISATKKIKGTFQTGGDASPSSEFTFQYYTGGALTDMLFADSPFGLDYAYNQQHMILGSFKIDGEANISDWFSTDDGRSWTRIT